MMGSILICDGCLSTGGAKPAHSGAMARLAAYRGTIRRVRLGYTVVDYGIGAPVQRAPWAVDLCGTCRDDGRTVELMRGRLRERIESHGRRWEDAP